MAEKILQIRNLTAGFLTDQGVVKATDRVTFDLEKGTDVMRSWRIRQR